MKPSCFRLQILTAYVAHGLAFLFLLGSSCPPDPSPVIPRSPPSRPETLVSGLESLALGHERGCMMSPDKTLTCWDKAGFIRPEVLGPLSTLKFKSISYGGLVGCGIQEDGNPACWDKDFRLHFPMLGNKKLKAITLSAHNHCGLTNEGLVHCWKLDLYGPPIPMDTQFIAFDLKDFSGCGILPNQTLKCWGQNMDERHGLPQNTKFQAIAIGKSHACGIKDDGRLVCWGDSDLDQRQGLDELNQTKFKALALSDYHGCGIREDDTLACWGNTSLGQNNGLDLLQNVKFKTIALENARGGCGITLLEGELLCWGTGEGTPKSRGSSTSTTSSPPTSIRLTTPSDGHRFLIVTHYTQDIREMATLAIANHKSYAHELGYRYKDYEGVISGQFADPSATKPVYQQGLYWQKIAVIQKLLAEPTTPEWILWIDSDAVFTNFDKTLQDIVKQYGTDKDLIVPLDATDNKIHINNGVFLIRNSDWSRAFMAEVVKHFASYKATGTPEQDAMRDVMYAGKDGKNFIPHRGANGYTDNLLQERIAVVHQRIMDSFYRENTNDAAAGAAWQNGDFIAHVSGLEKDKRTNIIRDLTELVAGQVLLDHQIREQFAHFDGQKGDSIKQAISQIHQRDPEYHLMVKISHSDIDAIQKHQIKESTRADDVMSLLRRVKTRYNTLPDVELVVYLRDEPQVPKGTPNPVPIFSFQTTPNYLDILFPYAPTYLNLESGINQMRSKSIWSWESKIDKLVWRGTQTGLLPGNNIGGLYTKTNWKSYPRSKLVLACHHDPSLCDAGFSGWTQVAEDAKADILAETGGLKPSIPERDMQQWRYIASVDGNGWADRLARLMASSSVVAKQESDHVEFWYGLLKPYVNYLPLEHDFGNLKAQIHWARNHPNKARAIVSQANRLVQMHLSEEQVDRYIYRLLQTLSHYEGNP